MAEDIRNISLSNKKTFSIDGDLTRTIQLDTSDMNILVRMEEVYPEIERLAVEAADKIVSTKKTDKEDGEESVEISSLVTVLKEIDNKMREKLNYIFASDVADACEPKGNMYDVVGGEFRFEHIIGVLSRLYANDITSEFKKMQTRVKKHTEKYTGRRSKK